MWLRASLVLWVSIFLPSQAGAAVRHYTIHGEKFSLDVSAGWQEVSDLFGLPLALLGTADQGQTRPVVSISPLAKSNETSAGSLVNPDGIHAFLNKYHGAWISDSKDTSQSADESTYRYSLGGIDYTELTLTVACHSRLFQLKGLVQSSQHSDSMKHLLRSFSCD